MHIPVDPPKVWKDSIKSKPGTVKAMAPKAQWSKTVPSERNEAIIDRHAQSSEALASNHGQDEDVRSANAPEETLAPRERSSTLATRRQIQHPPEKIETLLPSDVKAIATARRTAEEEDRQRRDEDVRTPTPRTADFKEMLESFDIPSPEVERVVEMYERMAESRTRAIGPVGRDYGGQENGDEAEINASGSENGIRARDEGWQTMTELRVKYKLFPAMMLLSRPTALTSDEVIKAADYARSAFELAQKKGMHEALQARCMYYVGLAEYLLARKDSSSRPLSLLESFSLGGMNFGSREEQQVRYFEQACAANSVYVEGDWAEGWVKRGKNAHEASGDAKRPTSVDSWMGSLWRNVLGRRTRSPTATELPSTKELSKEEESKDNETDETNSLNSGSDHAQRTWERIPSFSSIDSDESSRPTSSGSLQSEESKGRAVSKPDSETAPVALDLHALSADELFSNSHDDGSASPTLPPPVTAPNQSSAKSTSITMMPNGSSNTKQPIHQRSHSRKPSLLARVTGRERQPSELERAEEGDSPFKGSFGESVKPRSEEDMRSTQAEDLV